MPQTHKPRSGSMQFWPRKRARRAYARVRSWGMFKEAKPLGFAGYKVGMLRAVLVDNRKHAQTKGEDIVFPVTLLECPPLQVLGYRCYVQTPYGKQVATEVIAAVGKDVAKHLKNKISLPKKQGKGDLKDPDTYQTVTLLVSTQPGMTSTGKKTPEIFEIALGGKTAEQFTYAKEHIGKELTVEEVLQEGQQVDTHAVTKGKGFQGPIKRFGIGLRSHKSEKTKRGPGSLGAWKAQGKTQYRVAHAGKMGYHTRTEYNKWLLKIEKEGKQLNPKGGFKHYGLVQNPVVLLKGSVQGPAKRMIRLNVGMRQNKKIPQEAPSIQKMVMTE